MPRLVRSKKPSTFDRGYLTVTKDYQAEVSKRIKEDYGNGQEYYAMHGKQLMVLPGKSFEQPSVDFIEWHNKNVFVS